MVEIVVFDHDVKVIVYLVRGTSIVVIVYVGIVVVVVNRYAVDVALSVVIVEAVETMKRRGLINGKESLLPLVPLTA